MTTLTKAAAGMGALGTAAGGGVLLSKSPIFNKSKPTLRSEVEGDKWVFLTSRNTEEITKVLSAYKANSPTVTLKFDGITGNESDASKKLLEKCKELYEKPSDTPSKEDLLKKLKKWCVIPKTVNQRLGDLNYTALSTDGPTQGTTESNDWKQKSQSHTSSSNNKFTGISVTGTGNDDASAKALREHCKTKLEVNSFSEDFQDTLEKVKLWCSVTK
ncbi:hypothetical protein HF1_12220 [Mycoplasma haemofelis str. Langford 1]|uniref:Uncharacterized protein n=1 Tax=Mycoplasma haemofelis (strain Langford 1) TaxID=941640 RepID=E8ZJA9_MYCHL|nr:hypothetical protein [Mycoplasma haemofelis]CBY93230.1 hypothetical protein HF1_12220 [Mycoplasma haemofelis str. Langford 1]